MKEMFGQKLKGVSAAKFVRKRTARAVGRQETGEHQDEDQSPQKQVTFKIFLYRIHLGLEVSYSQLELISTVFIVFKQVKRCTARA